MATNTKILTLAVYSHVGNSKSILTSVRVKIFTMVIANEYSVIFGKYELELTGKKPIL